MCCRTIYKKIIKLKLGFLFMRNRINFRYGFYTRINRQIVYRKLICFYFQLLFRGGTLFYDNRTVNYSFTA
jgi:hypothetical protein